MRYNPECRGDPWPTGASRPNGLAPALSWKAQAIKLGHWRGQPFIFPTFDVASTVMAFLDGRVGPDGKPLANIVKQITVDGNWTRFAIEPPDVVERLLLRFGPKNCDRAYQAVRFGCLYSILFSRQLSQTVNPKGKASIPVFREHARGWAEWNML